MSQLQDINLLELLNALVARIPSENPLEYVDKMYASINPAMIMEAVDEAKAIVNNENILSLKSKKAKEDAEVYLTLGGDSLNKSFYTGIISTLLWIPKYLEETRSRFGISERDIAITQNVLKQCMLPQTHDVKEEVINGEKVTVEPSNVRHYSAFLSSIVSWLTSGVSDFKLNGLPKTNIELSRYLTSVALNTFPSVPFASYHLGNIKTLDIFNLSEKLGKSFDWNKFMTNECYMLNEPKFVVTTPNAPIVGIVGHPLTDTFVAEIKDGQAKWIGMFIDSDEFSKLCALQGLTSDQIKKYMIRTTIEEHSENVAKKDQVACFIENQKLTKQCFQWRHQFSSTNIDYKSTSMEYDV